MNEFKEFRIFNVLRNISAIEAPHSPHKLGFFVGTRAAVESLEKFILSIRGRGGGRKFERRGGEDGGKRWTDTRSKSNKFEQLTRKINSTRSGEMSIRT